MTPDPRTALLVDERRAAFARVAHKLRVAHDIIAEAEAENLTHGLGLTLPPARDVLNALSAVCQRFHREHTP